MKNSFGKSPKKNTSGGGRPTSKNEDSRGSSPRAFGESKGNNAARRPDGRLAKSNPSKLNNPTKASYGNRSEGEPKYKTPSEVSNRFSKRDIKPFERKPFDGGNREGRQETGDRRPFGGERKSFGGGNREGRQETGDRRAFGGERKSFGGERKPFDGERKPYGDRERKPFDGGNKEGRQETGDRRPFGGERKSFGGERKPFDSERKPYGDRERKPFDVERKPIEEREKRPRRVSDKDEPSRYQGNTPNELPAAPNYDLGRVKVGLSERQKKKIDKTDEIQDGLIRLNRYISNAGICSRRDADKLIIAGEIKVNGVVVTEMGHKVNVESDVIKYNGKILNREKMVYILLNKPKDYITTTQDPQERKTVMDLVKDAGDFRLYPVGRLDRNTTGLLLLTNDGELAGKLAHPSNEIAKMYQVEIDKPLTDAHFDQIKAGITLEDGLIKADDLGIVTPDKMVIGIKIHSGKNRVVRRIFEHLGYDVLKLDRTTYAGLDKKDLPRGRWRFLNEKELIRLKYMM